MIKGAKELLEDYYNCPLDQIKNQKNKSNAAMQIIGKYFPQSIDNPEDKNPEALKKSDQPT
jgi:hypothetical protein